MCCVLVDILSRFSTSIPVPPGMLISSRINCGAERRAAIHACSASTAKTGSNSLGLKNEASN